MLCQVHFFILEYYLNRRWDIIQNLGIVSFLLLPPSFPPYLKKARRFYT